MLDACTGERRRQRPGEAGDVVQERAAQREAVEPRQPAAGIGAAEELLGAGELALHPGVQRADLDRAGADRRDQALDGIGGARCDVVVDQVRALDVPAEAGVVGIAGRRVGVSHRLVQERHHAVAQDARAVGPARILMCEVHEVGDLPAGGGHRHRLRVRRAVGPPDGDRNRARAVGARQADPRESRPERRLQGRLALVADRDGARRRTAGVLDQHRRQQLAGLLEEESGRVHAHRAHATPLARPLFPSPPLR